MKRRLLLRSAAAGLPALLPRIAPAQPAPRRIGVLAPSTAAREAVTLKPFFEEMRQLGWIEGRRRCGLGHGRAHHHGASASLHLNLQGHQEGPADQPGERSDLGLGILEGGRQQGLAGGFRSGGVGLGAHGRQPHAG